MLRSLVAALAALECCGRRACVWHAGMRALKSVLVTAGSLKRSCPDVAEELVLIRAMRESNVPKFLSEVGPMGPALYLRGLQTPAASSSTTRHQPSTSQRPDCSAHVLNSPQRALVYRISSPMAMAPAAPPPPGRPAVRRHPVRPVPGRGAAGAAPPRAAGRVGGGVRGAGAAGTL